MLGDVETEASSYVAAETGADDAAESVSSFAGEVSPADVSADDHAGFSGVDFIASSGRVEESNQSALPAGFGAALRMARTRGGVRRFRLLAYPGAAAVDAMLPWAIGLACLVPVIWQGANLAHASNPQWVGFTMYGLTLLLFLNLIVPATTHGLRIAAQMLHFQLPPSPGWRILGIYSLPFALAAMFYWQMDGMSGLIFGLVVGALLVAPLLLVVMQLHWVEATVAWMTSVLFFFGSVAVTAGVMFVVGLIITASTAGAPAKPPAKVIVQSTTRPAIINPATEPVAQLPDKVPLNPPMVPTTGPTDVATLPPSPPIPPPDDGGFFGGFPSQPPPVGEPPKVPKNDPPVPEPAGNHNPLVSEPTTKNNPPVPEPVLKPGQIVVKSSPIVKVVKELNALGDIDALLESDVAGGTAVVLKRTGESDRLVAVDLAKSATGGETTFKSDPQVNGRYVSTPAGDGIVRLASWPKLRAELLPLTPSRVDKAMNLNDVNGTATLLGVATSDVLLIGWQKNEQYAAEPWSLKTGQALRGFRVPTLIPNGTAISSDGKTLAVAAKIDGAAEVFLFDIASGRFRKYPITGLDAKWPLEPVALTFSPDSSRLAICFEHDGGILVSSWIAATGKALPDQTYTPGRLPIPARTAFTGRALDWAGDNTTWLLYGQILLDANSGQVLGVLGIDQTIQQHVIDSKTLVLLAKVNSGANRLVQVELDPAAIAKLRPGPPK